MNIFTRPSKEVIERILSEAGLPVSDITAEHLAYFFGYGAEQEPDGVVGIESYGKAALLRSLAVVPSRRGNGVGTSLVTHIEQWALQQGIESLYLLTTTAEAFFTHLGYVRVSREEAPLSIRNTKEFSCLCPSSSAFMLKQLQANPPLNRTRADNARAG
jgi:amino-acid N-acetyltransferase